VEETRSAKWYESWQEEEPHCAQRGPAMTFAQAFYEGLVLDRKLATFRLLARRDDRNSEFFCI
jgi:hypothetical protein